MVQVNSDIGEIDVGFIDQTDPSVNSVGVKGLGEVAMVDAGLDCQCNLPCKRQAAP